MQNDNLLIKNRPQLLRTVFLWVIFCKKHFFKTNSSKLLISFTFRP